MMKCVFKDGVIIVEEVKGIDIYVEEVLGM